MDEEDRPYDELEIREITAVKADVFNQRAAGESARIILTGAQIGNGFAAAMPLETSVLHMTSVLDVHRYEVTVRGYTIGQFEAILDAYLCGDDEAYDRQIESLRPKRRGFPD